MTHKAIAVHPPRSRRVEGKVAIVTGGGSSGPGLGTGKAISTLLSIHGATVVVADVAIEAAQETVALLESNGGVGVARSCDVTSAESCKALVASTASEFGKVDILINNVAKLGPIGTVVETSEEDWASVMQTNLTSMMLMCKYAIPSMPRGGTIVNISSAAAYQYNHRAAYSASKGAVIPFTVMLAGQQAPNGIRANCILPGRVWTPLSASTYPLDADLVQVRQERIKATPLGTEGTSWDIGYLALFLASDEAQWITGQSILVDGGSFVRPST